MNQSITNTIELEPVPTVTEIIGTAERLTGEQQSRFAAATKGLAKTLWEHAWLADGREEQTA